MVYTRPEYMSTLAHMGMSDPVLFWIMGMPSSSIFSSGWKSSS